MIRRVLLIGVPLLLLIVAVAQAHKLTLAGANRVANREAAKLARAGSVNGERVTYLVGKCTRAKTRTGIPKPHTVDCAVVFSFRELGQDCDSVIRVAFAREGSTRIIISYPGQPDCKAR